MTYYELLREVQEAIDDEKREIFENPYPSDQITEIVDSSIPVYTTDLLDIAKSELWIAVEEPETYGFNGDKTPINGIVGNLFQKLQEDAMAYWEDVKEEHGWITR